MSRRRKKQKPSPQLARAGQAEPRPVPWYKRYWVVVSGACAVVVAILINGPQALHNSRVLPSEISKTISQFRSWLKEDSDWTGKWTAHPEGYADLEDMKLSNVDLEIVIWATEGQIGGTIATKRLCKALPMYNYIQLEGSVFGNSAKVTAWDIIGGRRVDFARLTLERDGHIMTVTPTSGNTEWFPASARISRDPSAPEEIDKLDADHTFCSAEREAFFKSLRDQRGEG